MSDIPPNEAERPELERILATLRGRWVLIVACFAATTIAALGFSLAQTKEYSASASLLFRDPGYAEALYGTAVTSGNPDPAREAATNVRLVGLGAVAQRTAAGLGEGWTESEVSDRIEVSELGESDVVSVTATDPSARRAALLANAFARQFIAFRTEADRGILRDAQRRAERQFGELTPAEREGPRGTALSAAAERLGVLASLQTGNAELVEAATVPTSPSSPKVRRNTLLGAVAGLLLGLGMALLVGRLDRRLRDPEELGAAYGLPALGTIPLSGKMDEPDSDGRLPFMEEEAFRMLRAGLRYFNVDRDLRTTLVTSHGAGEGKSTVAWHLARMAATGSRAILVEADLRDPGIAPAHGLPPGPGMAELLTHQVELGDAVQEVPLGGEGSDGAGLSVIVAGSVPPNPAELLESRAMSALLERLGAEYDFVVVDTPPIGVVSDAFPLLTQVAGVIVVGRLGVTSRDAAAQTGERLRQLGAPLLGVVANAVKARGRGRYGYGYGYYGRRESSPGERTPAASG